MPRPRHLRRQQPLPRLGAFALLALLIVPILELGLWEAWHDAPTYDEGIYLSTGVDMMVSHQWRLTLEHPPLSRAVAVLPALFAHPVIPPGHTQLDGDEYAWTRKFLAAQQRAGKLRLEVFLARLVPLVCMVLTGLVIYAIAARLTDRWGGVVAAGLWFTLPTTLGFGHLLSLDVALCLTLAFTAWTILRAFERPGYRAAALVGIATGLDLLVRSTSIPVVPVAGVLVLAASWGSQGVRRALASAAGVGVVGLATVWVGIRLIAPGAVRVLPASEYAVPFSQSAPVPPLEALAARIPFPHSYSTGLRLLGRLSPPAPGYLLGHRWIGWWWAYWPITLLAKIPLPALVVVLVGLVGWMGVARVPRRRALVVLLPLAVVAALPAAVTTRQLGVRLALPVIMLLAIAAAPAARLARAPMGRLVLGTLCVLQLVVFATSAGSALAWTTPPLHPAYRSMADSSFDWGQDWYRLRQWTVDHDAWVAYFGSPGLGDILPAKNLLSVKPEDVEGWVAVSASYLNDYRAVTFSWLRAYCPVGSIGSTVLIYRFQGPPSSAPGPDTPAGPCWGATASHRGS